MFNAIVKFIFKKGLKKVDIFFIGDIKGYQCELFIFISKIEFWEVARDNYGGFNFGVQLLSVGKYWCQGELLD